MGLPHPYGIIILVIFSLQLSTSIYLFTFFPFAIEQSVCLSSKIHTERQQHESAYNGCRETLCTPITHALNITSKKYLLALLNATGTEFSMVHMSS